MSHKVIPAKELSGANIGNHVSGDVYVRGSMTGIVEGTLLAVYHTPVESRIHLRPKEASNDDPGWEFNIPDGANFTVYEKEEA